MILALADLKGTKRKEAKTGFNKWLLLKINVEANRDKERKGKRRTGRLNFCVLTGLITKTVLFP